MGDYNDPFSREAVVQRHREIHGRDPVEGLRPRLIEAWGSPGTRQAIKWPIFLRLGRV